MLRTLHFGFLHTHGIPARNPRFAEIVKAQTGYEPPHYIRICTPMRSGVSEKGVSIAPSEPTRE